MSMAMKAGMPPEKYLICDTTPEKVVADILCSLHYWKNLKKEELKQKIQSSNGTHPKLSNIDLILTSIKNVRKTIHKVKR